MISIEEALKAISEALEVLPSETVPISHASGRILAADVLSRRSQPPVAVSAMDGWAVRAADVATAPAELTAIGESPAGGNFAGAVGPGEAVRIFTGAPVPDGADCIVIQENVETDGKRIKVTVPGRTNAHIRTAGLDFRAGQVRLTAGRRLGPGDIALAAAMDNPWLSVRRKPRVALLSTGDELVRPGEPIGPNQIVSSNALALAAMIEATGGIAVDLGIARDNRESLAGLVEAARGVDMLVTLGGISVGAYDLVRDVLGSRGLRLDFWQIAIRPGKPLMFGECDGIPVLGIPGNPVSSLICGLVFLRPALHRLLGLENEPLATTTALLAGDLRENDRRQDYIRANLQPNTGGKLVATPFPIQDSSMLSVLADADCLIVRQPFAPAAKTGDAVTVIRRAGLW